MTALTASHGPAHFQRLYDADPDPWHFGTSEYERKKYRRTIESLGSRTFRSAFEVGCSIGIMTRLLAHRCTELFAVDIIEKPLASARAACSDQSSVRIQKMQVPVEWPDAMFDLIVLSEVLYFLNPADITAVANRVQATLEMNGLVLLVNWRGRSGDPCTGDEAAELFVRQTENWLEPQEHYHEEAYRLDVLCRTDR